MSCNSKSIYNLIFHPFCGLLTNLLCKDCYQEAFLICYHLHPRHVRSFAHVAADELLYNASGLCQFCQFRTIADCQEKYKKKGSALEKQMQTDHAIATHTLTHPRRPAITKVNKLNEPGKQIVSYAVPY